MTVIQDCPVPDPRTTVLGEGWYAKRIGVRMRMLGEPGTTAYVADTPQTEPHPKKPAPGPDEVGGVTIVAERNCSRTAFVALHEPFKAASLQITEFRRIEQSDHALAAAIIGTSEFGINDRVMFRLGDDHDEPLTVTGRGESFVFANYAYIRIADGKVTVSGDIPALKLHVGSSGPIMFINGKQHPARIANGYLVYSPHPSERP